MKAALKFCRLTIFKNTPAELPYSKPGLFVVLLMLTGINFVQSQKLETIPVNEFMMALFMNYILCFGLVYSALRVKRHQNRLVQIMMALFGVDLIFFAMTLVLHKMGMLQTSVVLMLKVWIWLVNAHIFQHGLDLRRGQAMMYTMFYQILSSLPLTLTVAPYILKMEGV